jgi:trigger factor
MRVVRKDNSPTNISLSIQAEASDLEPIHSHVLTHFQSSVKVPGFRTGKAPANLIEKNINQQALLDEFMEHALNELYRRALDQENIRPISTPNVQLKKFVPYTQLEFEAETEIVGSIKLPNYKNIKLAQKKVEVTPKDVAEVVKSLQTRLAERVNVDRAAKAGDELVIDFTGKDSQGKAVSGADGKDYPLILGSNTFIPGFEDHLIGVKTGQIKEFTVTFPKDYALSALQGKKVKFKADIKKVQELKEPKADDEFAKQVGPVNTFAELTNDIKKQLIEERQRQSETDYHNELVRKIADKTEIDVPKSLVEEENIRLEDQEKQNLAYRGQTWQEHLEIEGITEEEHRQRHYSEALERVKVGLILSEIAQKEGLTVTPEELEVRLQVLKGQYQDPQMQSELDKPANRRDIEARLMTEKTLAKLTDYAKSK